MGVSSMFGLTVPARWAVVLCRVSVASAVALKVFLNYRAHHRDQTSTFIEPPGVPTVTTVPGMATCSTRHVAHLPSSSRRLHPPPPPAV